MTCIAILETPNTAELASQLATTNPIPIEEISGELTALVPGAWFEDAAAGPLVELVDSLELGECLSLDENQLAMILYDGLRDVVEDDGKASESVWYFIDKMQTYLEEELGTYGAAAFLKQTCVFIKRLN